METLFSTAQLASNMIFFSPEIRPSLVLPSTHSLKLLGYFLHQALNLPLLFSFPSMSFLLLTSKINSSEKSLACFLLIFFVVPQMDSFVHPSDKMTVLELKNHHNHGSSDGIIPSLLPLNLP